MHPEIRQPQPGNCPICGMTLEPVMPSLDEEENPELADFRRRFWWTLSFTIVVTVLAMAGHRIVEGGLPCQSWIELLLSSPVVLWAGWPLLCPLGTVHQEAQPEYVDADRDWRRGGLWL
jgi:Cu+-exporting ATPase